MARNQSANDESAALSNLVGGVLTELRDALASAEKQDRVLFPRGIEHLHLKLAIGSGALELTVAGSGLAPTEPIALPDLDTDDGVLAHMMVAESKNPFYADYDAEVVKQGLRAMKAVVENRLRNDPSQFGAPGATMWTDIIVAPKQWEGFSRKDGKVQLSAPVQERVKKVLQAANTGAAGKFRQFVHNVLDVVAATADDPFKGITSIGGVKVIGGGYGWRTEGATSPGPRFVAVPADKGGIIAGNQFYTLKK
jgi:hypothetical protein